MPTFSDDSDLTTSAQASGNAYLAGLLNQTYGGPTSSSGTTLGGSSLNTPANNIDSTLLGGTSNASIGNNANGTSIQGSSTANFWYQPTTGIPNNAFSNNAAKKSKKPYDINYAYQQQALKNTNGNLRMSLSIKSSSAPSGTLVFRAHIDPNHLVNEQKKRIAKLDTLTGVVVQDFGFSEETIELRGTTGSAYYKEIATLDDIFNTQSTQADPNPVTLTIESRTYTCVWVGFTIQRQQTNQGGNLIEYSMNFIVLYRGQAGDTADYYTSAVQQNLSQSLASVFYTNGNAVVETVSTNGLSPYDYVNGQLDIPAQSVQDALAFISANWDPILNNGGYPGDDIALLPNQLLTVPNNWSDIL